MAGGRPEQDPAQAVEGERQARLGDLPHPRHLPPHMAQQLPLPCS